MFRIRSYQQRFRTALSSFTFSSYMWADGTLNLSGLVQNSRTFSTYMWASGFLDPDCLVDNSEVI